MLIPNMLNSNAPDGSNERLTAKARDRAASRRAFLKGSGAAGAGLLLSASIPGFIRGARAAEAGAKPRAVIDPNVFVRIAPDNTVTVISKHFDMGQGAPIGQATMVAEELDADWSQMRIAFAPNNAKLYNNLAFGPVQGTGGSTATSNAWEQMRQVGAAARSMLVSAAAKQWQVQPSEITVDQGVVSHAASNRKAKFGELAEAAMKEPVPSPSSLKLKEPGDWKLIGKRLPRLDNVGKTTGQQQYALDMRRPGMLTAVIQRAPQFGATLKSFDAEAAKKVPGVVDVVRIPVGVAVIAKDTWSAMRGRSALKTEWDSGKAETRSSDAILDEYRSLAQKDGLVALNRGDARAALAKDGVKRIEAEYVLPFLAHAPMEPLNGVIERGADGGIDYWSGSQLQTIDEAVLAKVAGVEPSKVRIHTVTAGGSFGRRGNPVGDMPAECAMVLKATGEKQPIHVVMSREDDIHGGYYRPMALHKVSAAVDAEGKASGWEHTIVCRSIATGTPFEAFMVKDGLDHSSVEGVADTPYAVPDMRVLSHNATSPVPVLWWRSVGHSHTAFVMETMVDELAAAAGKDPIEFRSTLLREDPRAVEVLKLAAGKAGWASGAVKPAKALEAKDDGTGKGASSGAVKGRGIAYHMSFGSRVALVADVVVDPSLQKGFAGTQGKPPAWRIEKIVAAVDCGIPVNPDIVAAQVEGAIGFALSTLLRNEVTFKDGHVVQSNFDDYNPTRIGEMPKVEVHTVKNAHPPSGIGEPGLPPLAPAVANALFAATGKRLRRMPFTDIA